MTWKGVEVEYSHQRSNCRSRQNAVDVALDLESMRPVEGMNNVNGKLKE